ncbi:MAG: prephenate dehydratase [Mycobacteriaceae bacterium]
MRRVSFLGPAGTFTEAACRELVDPDGVEFVPAATTPAAVQLVREGTVDAACVPVENSVEGSVPPTLDALATGTRLQVVAETELPVAFSVLVRPGTTAEDVHTVATHPHAAAQVLQWLAEHLPQAKLQVGSSTAAAAHDVAEGRVDAAVATALVGQRLGLHALAEGVADVGYARTRFVLVCQPCPPPARTGRDRTSVVLSLANTPGALVQAMSEFAIRGIDLTRIESRPTRRAMGTYRFYLDCVGHIEDPAVAEALAALHRKCTELRFLGSWPAADGGTGSAPPPPGDAEQWVADMATGRTRGQEITGE